MTSPHFVQVEEWQRMLRVWLAFGAIWLRNWVLEGAGTVEEGFWSFAGTLELPFGVEVSPIFVVRAAHAEIERRVELGGDGLTQLELDALARAWDRRLRASRRARRTRRRGTRMASGFGPPQGRVTAPQRRCSSSTWRAIRMQPRGANLTTSSWCPRAPLRLRRGSIDPARKVHLYRRLRSHPSRGGRACDPRRSAA